MYRRHGDKLALVFLAGDLLVTSSVWLGAYFLRYTFWPSRYGVPELELVGFVVMISCSVSPFPSGLPSGKSG